MFAIWFNINVWVVIKGKRRDELGKQCVDKILHYI